jgi:hypothetical protein
MTAHNLDVADYHSVFLPVHLHWPKPTNRTRAVGFWNLVGAVGFMICGAFGYSPVERWVEQSALSTFWGMFCSVVLAGLIES